MARVAPQRPLLTHQRATAYLVTRGYRFKRKERSSPAAPGLVARAVDDLERPTSPGRPLEHEPRAIMESVTGRDLGDVRVHTARLAPLNVQAATRGRDVTVEPGQDRFDTPGSLALLGHELTHVAQGGGMVRTKPVAQTAILPQAKAPARLMREEAEAESTEQTILDLFRPAGGQRAETAETADTTQPGTALPVPRLGQSAPEARVQRQPLPSFPDVWEMEEELVGAEEEEAELPTTEEEEGYLPDEEEGEEEEILEPEKEPEEKELDPDHLARQVYPFIKRMLAVERERTARQ